MHVAVNKKLSPQLQVNLKSVLAQCPRPGKVQHKPSLQRTLSGQGIRKLGVSNHNQQLVSIVYGQPVKRNLTSTPHQHTINADRLSK